MSVICLATRLAPVTSIGLASFWPAFLSFENPPSLELWDFQLPAVLELSTSSPLTNSITCMRSYEPSI